MKRVSKTVINELGNRISIVVTREADSVHIFAAGPSSTVDHTWTPDEAQAIQELLEESKR